MKQDETSAAKSYSIKKRFSFFFSTLEEINSISREEKTRPKLKRLLWKLYRKNDEPKNIQKTLFLGLVSIKKFKWTFSSISGPDGFKHFKSPITLQQRQQQSFKRNFFLFFLFKASFKLFFRNKMEKKFFSSMWRKEISFEVFVWPPFKKM